MDFLINDVGEINFEVVSGNDLRVQNIKNRIKSVKHDWLYDNIGCDLEKYIGHMLTSSFISTTINQITDDLVINGLIERSDINVKPYLTEDGKLFLKVHIKDMYTNSVYDVVDVEFDLFNYLRE